MVRKVKAYLENVNNNIITDEEVLHRMSVEIEAPANKRQMEVSVSSSSLRSGGRPPSPTPSRSSGLSQLSEGKKSLASSGETTGVNLGGTGAGAGIVGLMDMLGGEVEPPLTNHAETNHAESMECGAGGDIVELAEGLLRGTKSTVDTLAVPSQD